MARSQGSRSRLSYITEVTYGTTPAGNFLELTKNTFNTDLTKELIDGNELNSNRQKRYSRHGTRTVTGDLVVDLRAAEYDALIESAMFSTWTVGTPDTIKIGQTLKSFSIEEYAADIDQASLFTGMVVNSMAVSIQNNQTVQTTFNFLGKDMAVGGIEKTVTAAAIANPFDGNVSNSVVGVADTGSTASSINTVTGIDFSINNNLEPSFNLGSAVTGQTIYGNAVVEGTITAYFEDLTLFNRFLNETETNLEVSVANAAGLTYSFIFPRCKFNGAPKPVDGPGARLLTIPFQALYDATALTTLIIERP